MLANMKVLKKLFLFMILIVGFQSLGYAGEKKLETTNDKLNFYSGMFDFNDDGKRSVLFGIQHQNEELFRESFLGTLSPVTGGMITADNAIYLYTGIQAEYEMGSLKFTPSFTPGIYEEGEGKDGDGSESQKQEWHFHQLRPSDIHRKQ